MYTNTSKSVFSFRPLLSAKQSPSDNAFIILQKKGKNWKDSEIDIWGKEKTWPAETRVETLVLADHVMFRCTIWIILTRLEMPLNSDIMDKN